MLSFLCPPPLPTWCFLGSSLLFSFVHSSCSLLPFLEGTTDMRSTITNLHFCFLTHAAIHCWLFSHRIRPRPSQKFRTCTENCSLPPTSHYPDPVAHSHQNILSYSWSSGPRTTWSLLPRCSPEKITFNCNQSAISPWSRPHDSPPSSFIYSQPCFLSSGHAHVSSWTQQSDSIWPFLQCAFSRYCWDRFFERQTSDPIAPPWKALLWLSGVFTVKLLFIVTGCYMTRPGCLSILSFAPLHLKLQPVILDKLQVTEVLRLMAVLSLWTLSHPPDWLLLTLQVSAQVSPLKPFLQSSGSATPGLCFHITICTLLLQH